MHPMLNIALRAVRKAGHLITKNYENPDIIENNKKIKSNFITKIDYVEDILIEIIHKSYPEHTIITKKNGDLVNNQDIQWIINPLNGRNNFIKRFPHFSISIAIRIKGRISIAVIYDPMRNELFTAVRGQGAQLNGYRLRGSNARELKGSILAIGCPFKRKTNSHDYTYLNLLNKIYNQHADFRYTGCKALDLAYVAAGRVDGYFEYGLNLWDIAAGELLVREAGGIITDFIGGHNYIDSGNIVASNTRILKIILYNMNNEFID
ncbi:inositol-1-monophosphatase [Pantoea sp. Aalb]|uniref:inositol-1-monophosphatase n=1 Tax=Pantoea sp. Aalb TaxID=2576762 RepID=UPI00132AE697|nr:inositol-1-monophosphatase [Pantoea sp. Aalb]MXP67253.1 inositol-1-monophosphatase [Pantoea sp. Aalb]